MRSIASTARPPCRPGFTLIELLIVVAIMSTLGALVIGAVFSLRASQMKSFTETTVQKLHSGLESQWKAVLDQIKEEVVPTWALTMANNDLRRARVIYTKARLKQEFPVTFFQAKHPYASSALSGNYPGALEGQIVISPSELPAKTTYAKALAAVPVTPPAAGGTQIPAPQKWESSALLYLALSQGRRGMAANDPENQVDPTAIKSIGEVDPNAPASVRDLRVFVDSWGEPVRFFIFPHYAGRPDIPASGTDPADDLNSAALTSPSSGKDPQDPENTLFLGAWPGQQRTRFQGFLHPLMNLGASSRNLIPVVASAGPDNDFGHAPSGDPADAWAFLRMGGTAADDNIYSFRLRRVGARGE